MKARVIFTCAFLFSFKIMGTKIKTTFVLLFVATLLSFKDKPKQPTLYGDWNFRYLLVNDSIKMWKMESYPVNSDGMNLHLYKKLFFFYVFGTCFDIYGTTFHIEKDSLIFVIDTIKHPAAIQPFELKNYDTDFRQNQDNVIGFFNGTRKFEFVNDSILKIYKTKDTAFVFLKFGEEE